MRANLRFLLQDRGGPLVAAVVEGEEVSYWRATAPFDRLSVSEDLAGGGPLKRDFALLRLQLPLKLEVQSGMPDLEERMGAILPLHAPFCTT